MPDKRRGRPGRYLQSVGLRLDRLILALGRAPHEGSGHGRPRGILRIFRLAEYISELGHTFYPLRAGGVLRYELARAPRRPLPLPGRPPVRRGERIISLHFDNRAIAALAAAAPNTQALTWRFARAAIADLRELALLARRGALPADVRVAWGESIIYRALARYGFTTRPLPRTLRTPFARLFLLALMAIYGQKSLAQLSDRYRERLDVGEVWIGLPELQRRYLPAGAESGRPLAHAPDAPDQDTA